MPVQLVFSGLETGLNRKGLVWGEELIVLNWPCTCVLSLSYVMRMKEFERERRLLARKKRIEQKERAAAAASSS